MTIEEVKALSDNKLRIKVAKLCGYKYKGHPDHNKATENFILPHVWALDPNGELVGVTTGLPNYPQDLNAMHEAEKIFIGDVAKAFTYSAHLLQLNGQGWLIDCNDLNVDHGWITAFSTARQRAEAFVLTLSQ